MAYSLTHTTGVGGGSRRHRAAAVLVVGVGLVALCDVGLLIAGVLTWSTPVAMLAVGLVVSTSMAMGYELARTSGGLRPDLDAAGLGGLAHDLRAPLTTTRTLLELVESGTLGSLSPEASDALGRAAVAASRVEALLQGSLTRTTSAAAPLPRTDLTLVLDRSLESLHAPIAESGAVIERGSLPVVQAEPSDMERVLTNLILNAITHARPGEAPHISVSADREGSSWVVSVRDDGPGIPPALRERAFDPGMRGFSARQSPGFGLGLSTVRRLVEEQGGRAWIDPTSDDGACIRMLLPAA